MKRPSTLILGCGALAREMVSFVKASGADNITIKCLPAELHNTPALIPGLLGAELEKHRGKFEQTYVLYGDCGTVGGIDRVCEKAGAERIPGAHCYQFYMGGPDFEELQDREPTCFFLTDYLVRNFDRLVIKGLGLDRYPELRDDYFGNYTMLVYLAQTENHDLDEAAQVAAEILGLTYARRQTGLGDMEAFLTRAVAGG